MLKLRDLDFDFELYFLRKTRINVSTTSIPNLYKKNV